MHLPPFRSASGPGLRPFTRLALSAALLSGAALVTPAAAFEPTGNEIADTYLTLLESGQNETVTVGKVEASGDVVTLSDLLFVNNGDDGTRLSIDTNTLKGATIEADGRLTIETLALQGIRITDKQDTTVTAATAEARDVTLPSVEDVRAERGLEGKSMYREVDVDTIRIDNKDGRHVTVGHLGVRLDDLREGVAHKGSLEVSDLNLPLDAFDPKGRAQIRALGYSEVNLGLKAAVGWAPETSTLTIESLHVDARDMASLDLSLTAGGVTKPLMDKLQAVSALKPSREEQQKLQQELLQSVTVNSITLDLVNHGLYERVIELQAQGQGVSRQDLEKQLGIVLPMALVQIQDTELRRQAQEALTAFLATPGSLRATATPATPPVIGVLMGAGMMAPNSLPGLLGLKVEANPAN
ncbi:hypothetical protein [Roseibium aestuarii]|uniref:DUF5666 domain-containing protein n=1 Tax=Roseibium aestuarii TaxID=2600299 RepID=A0ABW4JUK8_9HYPH|nr:hypothetical protein [Roseibium aestuarii]